MTALNPALLSVIVWIGTAQVDVMIWEPGGEHPYTTDSELEASIQKATWMGGELPWLDGSLNRDTPLPSSVSGT
jgi:hypothetical protein